MDKKNWKIHLGKRTCIARNREAKCGRTSWEDCFDKIEATEMLIARKIAEFALEFSALRDAKQMVEG